MTGLPWSLRRQGGIEHYELAAGPGLLVAFTNRQGGLSLGAFASLNLSSDVGDDTIAVRKNMELVKQTLRIPALVTMKQTHSDVVLSVLDREFRPEPLEGDAAFTNLPGIGLGVRVADCLPVFVYAQDASCVGIAHCGWRGTALRIAEKLAFQMAERLSVLPGRLRFALGPCICPGCYPVGEDVFQQFRKSFPDADRFFVHDAGHDPIPLGESGSCPKSNGHCRLDLRSANRWLLREMGLTETGSLDLCTREHPEEFFSARRENPTGRNLAVVAIRQ